MQREPHEVQLLVQQYEQQLQQAPVPLWMDAVELLDVLDHYEQNNMYYESEQCIRLALRLHPDNPEVVVRKAYRLKNEGRWAEAAELVRTLPDQDGLDVRFFWGELALSELDFDRAEQLFNAGLAAERDIDAQLLSERGESPLGVSDIHLEMGQLFMDYGSTNRAQKYLRQIPHDAPEYPKAQVNLAECAYQMGESHEAFRLLETFLDEDPYHLDAWVMLADISYENRDYDKCAEAANFAIAIDPLNEKALRFKAVAALATERYDDVLTVYDTYRQHYPNDYTMALSAGEILINQGKLDEARTVLTRANQVCPNENPDKPRILSDIATTYAAQGQLTTAFEMLLGCCSLGSNYNEVVLQTAQMALQQRQVPFALEALRHYFENFPLNAETRLRISRMLGEANVFTEAPDLWGKLLDVSESGLILAAPYLAFAARRLLRRDDFFHWLAYSVRHDPTLTQQVFQNVYRQAPAEELLRLAHLEFPTHS